MPQPFFSFRSFSIRRSLVLVLFGCLCAATVVSPVSAGKTERLEVTYPFSDWASGIVSSARYSSDTRQSIGCYAYAGDYGQCFATDRNGVQRFCYTYDPVLTNAMHGINASSRIDFQFDTGSRCLQISVGGSSTFIR